MNISNKLKKTYLFKLLILVSFVSNIYPMDEDHEIDYYNANYIRESNKIKIDIEKFEQEKVNTLKEIDLVSQDDATQVELISNLIKKVNAYDNLIELYKEKERLIKNSTKDIITSVRLRTQNN